MASFGKKILSAFVEVKNEQPPVPVPEIRRHYSPATQAATVSPGNTEKFSQYFDKLFSEANMPGPDYYEFAKMTQAMLAIADEKARYCAAFAGLSVQGLDKTKLLETASAYVSILEKDAENFNSTVDAALQEKVRGKLQEIEHKQQRIAALGREISELQASIGQMKNEVKENEEKIENNTGGYRAASQKMKDQVLGDIEKIRRFVEG